MEFWPALVPLLFVMWQGWRHNRYAFMVELFIFMGGYGYIRVSQLPVNPYDVALLLGFGGMVLYRKTPLVRKLTVGLLLYFVALVLIARTSQESMGVQFRRMRLYMGMVSFFIPLLIFAGREFRWDKFLHQVVVFALTICVFYALDGFLFNGGILVPSATWMQDSYGEMIYSSTGFGFLWQPFDRSWLSRHYPYGLYWMALCILPLALKRFRLKPWQWVAVVVALLSSRTMTFTAGLVITFVCFAGKWKLILKYALGAAAAIAVVYWIDSELDSPMRVASTIDQFLSLTTAVDAEDLSKFASGRMAQIIPKWLLLFEQNRQWLGFGFLHPELSDNAIFQVHNEFYTDISRADEVATGVEVTQVQTILDIGFLGLMVQAAFYVWVYWMIRHLEHARMYLCVLVAISLFGLGGFAGLNNVDGLFLLGLTLGAILLSNPEQCRYYRKPDLLHDT